MSEKQLFTDRRWTDPPAVIPGEYVGVSKNEKLRVAAFRLRKGFVTQEEYEGEVAEIEEKYKGIDPDKKI